MLLENQFWIGLISFASFLPIFIFLFLIARETAILEHYEAGTKYISFLKSVFWPIMMSGGISHRFLPLPWFDYSDKDAFEKKHILKKNWFILGLVLSFGFVIMLATLFGENSK